MNTTMMDKVIDAQGNEVAFSKVRKNEFGEYVVKVYVNGKYNEDATYYTDDRKDAEETRLTMIKQVEGGAIRLETFEEEEEKAMIECIETMKKDRLTENERRVLEAIMEESNFNGDSLDITKSWNEQSLENEDQFEAFADVKDYGCGMERQVVRGIFGSLSKKGLMTITKDDGCLSAPPCYWLTIDERQFDRIREYMG